MLKIAHRGAKGCEPENTLIAFARAIAMGADGVELDVHLSADGRIIVIHDETVNRTSNGNGLVAASTLEQLKKMRIAGKHEIPELIEVFELVDGRCLINIELKAASAMEPVCALIEQYVSEKQWKHSDFLVSSFDWQALRQMRARYDKIPIGVLAEKNLEAAVVFSKSVRAETIHPHFSLLTAENTKALQSAGFKVFAWTINEPGDIKRIKSYNPDGIISDFIDRL